MNKKSIAFFLFSIYVVFGFSANAQSKFLPLDDLMPTPNGVRTGSGAPGPEYWQQRVDYDISVELDDEKQSIKGSEDITFYNNSPESLNYLWVQLDQNIYSPESITNLTEVHTLGGKIDINSLKKHLSPFDGGYKILSVKDKSGKPLSYTINNTMMRVELPKAISPKKSYKFSIEWSYNINNQPVTGGRSGYEYFEKDGNYLYEIAQFFPRLAVYNDYMGWQNKQFLGESEFALPFGDYKVKITVPADHIVAATGELQNADKVLNAEQLARFKKAKAADKPVWIVTEEDARNAEKSKATDNKTWVFHAKDVRDFAFASSRKFIWEGMNVKLGNRNVMAMSLYPKEGNPLWGRHATASVVHALKVYSKYTVDYPYPVAIAVHGPVFGMEYPMISFNGARPDESGFYSERLKQIMISVIIHETGHNFFPMIINSDERQWAWMDEGLNSFVQYLAEQEWQEGYPSRRGPARNIVEFMKSDKNNQVPVMTNPESINQMGNISYGKVATALNILREVIMGKELFDYAFKEYCQRWAFKHPTPADFFRTMQDASAVDLDWFWRGWFYTTDHVDIALEDVQYGRIDKGEAGADSKGVQRESMFAKYSDIYASVSNEHKQLLDKDLHLYELSFKNVGGLVMPILLEIEYRDGSKEMQKIPAEVWRKNNASAKKVIVTEKPVAQFSVDPYFETADCDISNNVKVVKDDVQKVKLYIK